MAGRGPAPKPAHLRQRRNRKAGSAHLEAATVSAVPELAESRRANVASVDAAGLAARLGLADGQRSGSRRTSDALGRLALLWDEFYKNPDARVMAEIRLQEQRFGLSPLDRSSAAMGGESRSGGGSARAGSCDHQANRRRSQGHPDEGRSDSHGAGQRYDAVSDPRAAGCGLDAPASRLWAWRPARAAARVGCRTAGVHLEVVRVVPEGASARGPPAIQAVRAVVWRRVCGRRSSAAFVAIAELHQDAPVRFNGWRGRSGEPAPGRGVTDPFVVAGGLHRGAERRAGVRRACGPSWTRATSRDDFDIGLERIIRKTGDGKAVSLAGSPNARDGARTTFQLFDETHRMTLPRLKQAHQTMMANLPKRKIADAWALEITTAPEPGRRVDRGSARWNTPQAIDGWAASRMPSLFFFHRQASDEHDLTTQ